MNKTIVNQDLKVQSLQVSRLLNVPAGEFEPGLMFLLKNITDENITVEIRPAGQEEYISTILYPGWNVELVNAVKGVTDNTLQYGF
jgi:hypothetical protein